uniref:Uncharacterized protein n=2 Tax=Nothobranchius kadleci TaxID=1051664 RepID=A0A1A8BE70_NOTKA
MEPLQREKSTGKAVTLFWSGLPPHLRDCFICRKEIRKLLKRQMEEKSAQVKLQRISKANEAEHLLEVDRLALSSEKQQRIQHSKALTAYRDENKRVQPHIYIMHLKLMLSVS